MSKLNGTATKPATRTSRRQTELEIARIEGKIETIKEYAREKCDAIDPVTVVLVNDDSVRYVMQDSFQCWANDLEALFNDGKWSVLRLNLRRLSLLVEAAAALDEKVGYTPTTVAEGGAN